MKAEQEGLDQQAEIDAEVAASAVLMRVHRVDEQSDEVRDHVLDPVAAGVDAFHRRVAVVEASREQFLDARVRHLAAVQRVAE